MWVFTKKGFFSIVQDKYDEDYLIVRARVKGDIEEFTSELSYEVTVAEDEGSDYRYRSRIKKADVSALIASLTYDIDYTNYKAAVNTVDPRRSEYYGMVWAILADMQFEFSNPE